MKSMNTARKFDDIVLNLMPGVPVETGAPTRRFYVLTAADITDPAGAAARAGVNPVLGAAELAAVNPSVGLSNARPGMKINIPDSWPDRPGYQTYPSDTGNILEDMGGLFGGGGMQSIVARAIDIALSNPGIVQAVVRTAVQNPRILDAVTSDPQTVQAIIRAAAQNPRAVRALVRAGAQDPTMVSAAVSDPETVRVIIGAAMRNPAAVQAVIRAAAQNPTAMQAVIDAIASDPATLKVIISATMANPKLLHAVTQSAGAVVATLLKQLSGGTGRTTRRVYLVKPADLHRGHIAHTGKFTLASFLELVDANPGRDVSNVKPGNIINIPDSFPESPGVYQIADPSRRAKNPTRRVYLVKPPGDLKNPVGMEGVLQLAAANPGRSRQNVKPGDVVNIPDNWPDWPGVYQIADPGPFCDTGDPPAAQTAHRVYAMRAADLDPQKKRYGLLYIMVRAGWREPEPHRPDSVNFSNISDLGRVNPGRSLVSLKPGDVINIPDWWDEDPGLYQGPVSL